MIVKVPKYKKINESFFDDIEDDIYDAHNAAEDELSAMVNKDYEEKVIKPKVIELLAVLGITDITKYDMECTGDGIIVNIHDHLFLANKKLYTYRWKTWRFGTVDGNVYYSNNKLTDWTAFPKEIKGNCYANNNFIKNFIGAPAVLGRMVADKQLKKTDYPLTQENYDKGTGFYLHENSVYVLSKDMFGKLKDINESKGYCVVKLENGDISKCRLDDVNCLAKITDLLI